MDERQIYSRFSVQNISFHYIIRLSVYEVREGSEEYKIRELQVLSGLERLMHYAFRISYGIMELQ